MAYEHPTDTEYLASLDRKPSGASVLLFNEKGELLIENITYKDHWNLPGGSVDDNESPYQAAMREVREELSLTLTQLQFLGVDYNSVRGLRGDSYIFVFSGGTLTQAQIDSITIDENEMSEIGFFPVEEACQQLSIHANRRVKACLNTIKTPMPIYSEDGERV